MFPEGFESSVNSMASTIVLSSLFSFGVLLPSYCTGLFSIIDCYKKILLV